MCVCPACHLAQLRHTVSRDSMFRQFWYLSGVNDSMKKELADLVRFANDYVRLAAGDVVIDIGSNDGTLLKNYERQGLTLLGFEPALNMPAIPPFILNIPTYFTAAEARAVIGTKKAKIIFAIAIFYDVEEPLGFLQDVADVLADDGVLVVQMNYLPTMLKNNTFDDICHEHVTYWSLSTLKPLLDKVGLKIVHAETNRVNGGSIRMAIKKHGFVVASVPLLMQDEGHHGWMRGMEPYLAFGSKCKQVAYRLYNALLRFSSHEMRTYVYGASTRGTTILEYANITFPMVLKAADRNPQKWGREMVGTGIPIVSEEEARADNPDFFLVLPYSFLPEFEVREAKWRANGGKWIIPLPEPRVLL